MLSLLSRKWLYNVWELLEEGLWFPRDGKMGRNEQNLPQVKHLWKQNSPSRMRRIDPIREGKGESGYVWR